MKKSQIEETIELTFTHNRNTVDVHLLDKEGARITTVKDQNADLFLSHFAYGECQCDDIETIKEYLSEIL
jgi:hypothetical protein